jgi:hypothetical protein
MDIVWLLILGVFFLLTVAFAAGCDVLMSRRQ